MKIAIVTVAYNLPDATRALIASAVSLKHQVSYHIFLHSARPDVVSVVDELALNNERVIPYRYKFNRGLAKSWNEGMMAGYARGNDVVIIVNDDCIFSPGDLDLLAQQAFVERGRYMVSAMGFNHRLGEMTNLCFSCFAINPIALTTVGCFDENFFPIYFEDNDYDRRARLLGLQDGVCHHVNVAHGGSMAIHSDPALMTQNHTTFEANRDYYLRKWGGLPSQETFVTPFGQEQFSLYIPSYERQHPYGVGFDRTDQGIVKI